MATPKTLVQFAPLPSPEEVLQLVHQEYLARQTEGPAPTAAPLAADRPAPTAQPMVEAKPTLEPAVEAAPEPQPAPEAAPEPEPAVEAAPEPIAEPTPEAPKAEAPADHQGGGKKKKKKR